MSSNPPAAAPGDAVGFIGLGNMGAPMAAQLQTAGFRLVVHDARREAAAALLKAGSTWAENPADVARAARLVCLSLPGPTETRALCAGDTGLLAGCGPGSVILDFTTNSPSLVRELHARLAANGGAWLDAPVSGGVTGARSRRLTLQVGGSASDVARARPVLEAVADTVLHVGDVGAGDICKVVHNCAVFCADLAMVECFTAGIKAGVAPATLIDVFQRSGIGRNHDLHVAFPARLFRGNFSPPHFALATACKDMGLATELAAECGVPMALAERCAAEMRAALARGWGGHDENIFLTLQEERAGVAVRLPEAKPPSP